MYDFVNSFYVYWIVYMVWLSVVALLSTRLRVYGFDYLSVSPRDGYFWQF